MAGRERAPERRRPAVTPPSTGRSAGPGGAGKDEGVGGAGGRDGLRGQAVSAGRYLMARETLGILVRTGGMLLLTAIIGPVQYGLFAGPFFLVQFLAVLATAGIDIYLIRRGGEMAAEWYHAAFTCLLITSVGVAALGVGAAQLAAGVLPDPRMLLPLQVLLLSIPINILWIPARATLERAFGFRKLAMSELGADVAQYVLAVSLAVAGAGVWAAVYGFLARQLAMLVSSYLLASYRPRLLFDRARFREMLAFGFPLSSALLVRRGGEALVPQIVGAILGPAALGVVTLALRLSETANFVTRATNRLSMVALGKVADDLPRLRRAVEQVTVLQVLAVAPTLAALSFGGGLAMPLLLGEEWSRLAVVLPALTVGYLLLSLYTTSNAALAVLGMRRVPVTVALAAQVLHVGMTAVLVPVLGILGYGIAFATSSLGSLLGHRALRRTLPVSIMSAVLWALATAPLLLAPMLPLATWPVTALPLLVLLVLPRTRRDLVRQVRSVVLEVRRPA